MNCTLVFQFSKMMSIWEFTVTFHTVYRHRGKWMGILEMGKRKLASYRQFKPTKID